MEQRNIEELGPDHIDRFYVAQAIMYFHRNINEFDLGYFTAAEIASNPAIEQLNIRHQNADQ